MIHIICYRLNFCYHRVLPHLGAHGSVCDSCWWVGYYRVTLTSRSERYYKAQHKDQGSVGTWAHRFLKSDGKKSHPRQRTALRKKRQEERKAGKLSGSHSWMLPSVIPVIQWQGGGSNHIALWETQPRQKTLVMDVHVPSYWLMKTPCWGAKCTHYPP